MIAKLASLKLCRWALNQRGRSWELVRDSWLWSIGIFERIHVCTAWFTRYYIITTDLIAGTAPNAKDNIKFRATKLSVSTHLQANVSTNSNLGTLGERMSNRKNITARCEYMCLTLDTSTMVWHEAPAVSLAPRGMKFKWGRRNMGTTPFQMAQQNMIQPLERCLPSDVTCQEGISHRNTGLMKEVVNEWFPRKMQIY